VGPGAVQNHLIDADLIFVSGIARSAVSIFENGRRHGVTERGRYDRGDRERGRSYRNTGAYGDVRRAEAPEERKKKGKRGKRRSYSSSLREASQGQAERREGGGRGRGGGGRPLHPKTGGEDAAAAADPEKLSPPFPPPPPSPRRAAPRREAIRKLIAGDSLRVHD